jgi:hypothetical protein
MMLSATFNDISAISWPSVFVVEETGVPRENNRPVAVVIGIDCTGSCKSNYHIITTTMTPDIVKERIQN